jgi:hypothetical protein
MGKWWGERRLLLLLRWWLNEWGFMDDLAAVDATCADMSKKARHNGEFRRALAATQGGTRMRAVWLTSHAENKRASNVRPMLASSQETLAH